MITQIRTYTYDLGRVILSLFAISIPVYIGYVVYINYLFFNKAVLYSLIILVFFSLVIALAATCLVVGKIFLKLQEMSLLNKSLSLDLQRINHEQTIYAATAQQLQDKQIFLTEQRTSLGVVKFKPFPKVKSEVISASVLPALNLTEAKPEIKTTLVADLNGDLSTLIVCPKQGVGKTSLMGWIALERMKRGDDVVILDPHYHRENWKIWHPDLKVLGKGKNYPEIKNYFEYLKTELDRRYQSSDDFRNITVLMDEMATTCSEIGANDYFLNLLTEGRKSKIFFVGATHSTTVESIGIKGNGALKKGFSSILYMEDNFIIERVVFNARGNEISHFYQHPGKLDFSAQRSKLNQTYFNIAIDNEFNKTLEAILNNPVIDDTEIKILKAYTELSKTNEHTKTKICKFVFGYQNKKTGETVDKVLKMHDLESLKTD